MNLEFPGAPPARPSPLQRTRQLLELDREDIVVIVIYGVALGLLSLAVPIAVQSLVNTVAFGSLIQPLIVLTVLLAVALIGSAVLRALQVRIVEMLQRRLFVRIVAEISGRLPRVSARALQAANGPELLNRFFDVFTTQKSIASLLLGGIDALLIALVGLVVLAFYHPALLAFDIVLIVGAVIVLVPLGRGGTGTSLVESKAKYAVAGWLEEMARHPLWFKLAGGEQFARARAESLAKAYLVKRDKHFRVVFRQLMGALTIEVVASVALLAVGGLLVIERQLSIGQLVAAELIVTAVVASIAKLGGKVEIFYDLVAAVDKLGEIFDLPLERSGGESPPRGERDRGELTLEGVELDLHDQETLDAIDLRLQPGQWTVVSGASERVTSDLVDAIFGLVPPRAGTIEIDGHDSRDLSLRELRKRIAIVRETEILPGCVADNLRAANPDLTAEESWDVLSRVGLAEWVRGTPEGLRTDLLADGSPLSRTQSLELTIARGLAGKPSVLILDRTLDQVGPSERLRLFDALASRRDVTVLLISDDPELLARADHHFDLSTLKTAHEEDA
ncbi:MAG: ATP-binding cassette domain-containing protein [Myxococcales bacterium]|nr:ATP-binding cassette domain-containing protein [Myxococcales bacterium]MDH3484081.1 ATP-binding cassette domain-containing protein [Myxococcales bacterium]